MNVSYLLSGCLEDSGPWGGAFSVLGTPSGQGQILFCQGEHLLSSSHPRLTRVGVALPHEDNLPNWKLMSSQKPCRNEVSFPKEQIECLDFSFANKHGSLAHTTKGVGCLNSIKKK